MPFSYPHRMRATGAESAGQHSVVLASWRGFSGALSAARCCAELVRSSSGWGGFLPLEAVLWSQGAPPVKAAVRTPTRLTCLISFVLLIVRYPVGRNFRVLFPSKTCSPLSPECAQSQFSAALTVSSFFCNVSYFTVAL